MSGPDRVEEHYRAALNREIKLQERRADDANAELGRSEAVVRELKADVKALEADVNKFHRMLQVSESRGEKALQELEECQDALVDAESKLSAFTNADTVVGTPVKRDPTNLEHRFNLLADVVRGELEPLALREREWAARHRRLRVLSGLLLFLTLSLLAAWSQA